MHLKRLFLSAIVALVCLWTTSCAAMFDGTKDDLFITSDPPGALVRVGDQEGVTPVTLRIPKSEDEAVLTHPDFPGQEIHLAWERDFQAGFLILDILFTPGWGLVGCLIDGGTSAWYKHPPQVTYSFTTAQASPTVVKATRVDVPIAAALEASAQVTGSPSP